MPQRGCHLAPLWTSFHLPVPVRTLLCLTARLKLLLCLLALLRTSFHLLARLRKLLLPPALQCMSLPPYMEDITPPCFTGSIPPFPILDLWWASLPLCLRSGICSSLWHCQGHCPRRSYTSGFDTPLASWWTSLCSCALPKMLHHPLAIQRRQDGSLLAYRPRSNSKPSFCVAFVVYQSC